jgi:arabinoxylan arabinofuranohydrolase
MYNKKLLVLALLAFVSIFETLKAQNPIIQTIYTADPAPMVYKDTVFLYTGHDEDKSTWFTMNDWHIYSTTDMVNWTDRGTGLSLKNFDWAVKDAWAGQCIPRNGKFYWYVPINAKGLGMSIGVAVSDHPTGPFKDVLGKPMVSGGWGYIDPSVFIDDDGQAYLYWGNPQLYYVKLNKDMTSYDQTLGIVKVPLTDQAFKLRIHNAKNTFRWAQSIDGLQSHSIKNTADGKYYWFVSALDKATHQKVIAVAVSDKANGPFIDVLGKPFIASHTDGESINPTVIIDEDKQPWLTWGNSALWRVKLNQQWTSYDQSINIQEIPADKREWFAGKIKATVSSTEKRFTTYEEGPWLYKRKSLYYLLYPAGGVPEHLAYSTAPSATGPWTYRDTIMSVIGKGGAFTNHPGLIDFKGKTYLFYHNGALKGGGGFTRSVCVDELHFNTDGTIKRVIPTATAIDKAVKNVNPYNRIEAETIAWESGVETAVSGSNGAYVTDIDNDDYIKIRSVDFSKGAARFEASVMPLAGGNIEIRLGAPDGVLLGTCKVIKSDNKEAWRTLSAKVNQVKGLHDIYLVFKGGNEKLFNFDWWRFAAK